MKLFSFITRLFARPAPVGVAERLSEEARAEALKEARFLFSKGAYARELEPGEVADDEPRIGPEPM